VTRSTATNAVVSVCLVLWGGVGAGFAQDTRRVVIGPDFGASAFKRLWMGSGYRALWTAEVTLPVLDLKTHGGGLTPVRVVGQAQSLGLAFRGADGRAYTFRSLHKHPERMLPPEWRDAWPAKAARDLTSGTHPGAALIQAALARAVGVPSTAPRLVVMPDDAALGEFRKQFAHEIGTIDEFPLAGPGATAGFMGATEILTSAQFWPRWLESPENRVDSRALLAARILDLWVDNYDRHSGQWRWMRIPGQPLWQPLPEDPDFVLVRHDGLGPAIARVRLPDFLNFSSRYPRRLEGPLNNCYEIDRWLLSDLDREAWMTAARRVVDRLTDEVIESAVRTLPAEWYAISGARSAAELKARRAGLVDYALRVYALHAERTDIHTTDRRDVVTIARNDDNSVAVTVSESGSASPYYRRLFDPRETRELRVYLHGGDDLVTRTGRAGGPIRVRVIAGGGRDRVDDSTSGGSDVWRDAGNVSVWEGINTRVRYRAWFNPASSKETPWLETRNYGHWTTWAPTGGYGRDTGVLIGVGATRTAWGFRTTGAASEQTFRAAVATSDVTGVVEYLGTFRRPASALAFRVHTVLSGVTGMNFYGFGNETPAEPDRARYRARQDVATVAPSIRLEAGKRFEAYLSPELRYAWSARRDGGIIDTMRPVGSDGLGQAVLRAGVAFDSRERANAHAPGNLSGGWQEEQSERFANGVSLSASAFYAPPVWDLSSGYGGGEATLAAYVGGPRAHLAARLGGRVMSGSYPWFEAASVGGHNNRGYNSFRFAGDSSAFGTLSLRSWIGQVPVVVPVKIGVVGFAETGRVWLRGEASDLWHPSIGGGLLLQPVATNSVVSVTVGRSREGSRYYFGMGFPF